MSWNQKRIPRFFNLLNNIARFLDSLTKGLSTRAYTNTSLPNPGQNCNYRIENPQTLKVKFIKVKIQN